MSFTEVYEDLHERFIGVVVNEDIEPIRIVKIEDTELNPKLFEQAKHDFKEAPQYEPTIPLNIEWNRIERGCQLVATLTSKGGFIVHDDNTMSKHARTMFSKKARMNYAKKYNVPQAPNRRLSDL